MTRVSAAKTRPKVKRAPSTKVSPAYREQCHVLIDRVTSYMNPDEALTEIEQAFKNNMALCRQMLIAINELLKSKGSEYKNLCFDAERMNRLTEVCALIAQYDRKLIPLVTKTLGKILQETKKLQDPENEKDDFDPFPVLTTMVDIASQRPELLVRDVLPLAQPHLSKGGQDSHALAAAFYTAAVDNPDHRPRIFEAFKNVFRAGPVAADQGTFLHACCDALKTPAVP
ncbi:MAG: hypothetical protein L6Q57_00890 [Alphaproteobacteria bacterium]|nr:hypothetical protein [Alphaproteobacteria bacterium]